LREQTAFLKYSFLGIVFLINAYILALLLNLILLISGNSSFGLGGEKWDCGIVKIVLV